MKRQWAGQESWRRSLSYAGAWLLLCLICMSAHAESSDELVKLSIEELSNIPVTSVFKRPEPLGKSPASVYVITQEEIRRSGATSLPEVLRLAPNLEVARVNSSSYAISARGFNTFEASNKLLVLIDGRSVYTPLHAGVYWDQQQMDLSDVERIEVISGPGGTLWGSNAVNGVINVITRSAHQTTGSFVDARVGTSDHNATGRFGSTLGENGAFRVYAQGFQRGDTVLENGTSAKDDWHGKQAGFRGDWFSSNGRFTMQGDAFQNTFDAGEISGGNLLSRWETQLSNRSHLEVQAYYDRVRRDVAQVFDSLDTFDLSAQQSLSFDGHELVWGLGHRVTHDRFVNSQNFFALVPDSDTVHLSNLFAQDTIVLGQTTTLTIGSKFEYSTFSKLEALPSARLAWQVRDDATLWTAISRAVRTPSRLDRELTAPGLVDPAENLESEVVIAYELGYRGRFTQRANWSVSLYYNDYDRLRMLVTTPSGHFQFDNAMRGSTYGAEMWADYQVNSWWRVSGGINLIEKDLTLAPNAFTPVLTQHAGNDPHHQYFLRSSFDLPRDLEFDLDFRSIGALSTPPVPQYNELNARLGWRLSRQLMLSASGSNLLDSRHPETGAAPARSEIRRSGQLQLTWQTR